MEKEKVYAGIDIAKASLEIAVHATGQRWDFTNDDAGISQAICCLRELAPALVVLEATGGIELPLTAAMAVAGLPMAVVNPRQAREKQFDRVYRYRFSSLGKKQVVTVRTNGLRPHLVYVCPKSHLNVFTNRD